MKDFHLSRLSRGCGRFVASKGSEGRRGGRVDVCFTPQDFHTWKSQDSLLRLSNSGRLLTEAESALPKTYSTRRGQLLLYSQFTTSRLAPHVFPPLGPPLAPDLRRPSPASATTREQSSPGFPAHLTLQRLPAERRSARTENHPEGLLPPLAARHSICSGPSPERTHGPKWEGACGDVQQARRFPPGVEGHSGRGARQEAQSTADEVHSKGNLNTLHQPPLFLLKPPPVGESGRVAGRRGPGKQNLQDPREPSRANGGAVRGVLPLELRDLQNEASLLGPDGEIIQLSLLGHGQDPPPTEGDAKEPDLWVWSTEGEKSPLVIVLQPKHTHTVTKKKTHGAEINGKDAENFIGTQQEGREEPTFLSKNVSGVRRTHQKQKRRDKEGGKGEEKTIEERDERGEEGRRRRRGGLKHKESVAEDPLKEEEVQISQDMHPGSHVTIEKRPSATLSPNHDATTDAQEEDTEHLSTAQSETSSRRSEVARRTRQEEEEAAAQRLAHRTQRKRQEVVRKRREREEEQRKQQERKEAEEKVKSESEEERRSRAEDFRLMKLAEEEEERWKCEEEEEQAQGKREQAQREGERRRQEEMRRQMERLQKMKEDEEQRSEAECQRPEEERRQEEDKKKLQEMDEGEWMEYLCRKEQEEEKRRNRQEERKRREEAGLQVELLSRQTALLQQPSAFKRGLVLEAGRLEKTQCISRPWIFSYFPL